ncbi:MAG TPA: hypothetical protein VF157_00990, partial [Chloroflexota bacterium]
EAHHLFEKRHIDTLGRLAGWSEDRIQNEIRNAPSVILTQAEHDCFSAELDFQLPKGRQYDKGGLLDAYGKTYGNENKWIKAVTDFVNDRWPGDLSFTPE